MTEAMWVITAIVLVLPFVLMYAFNGRDRTDARGRRLDASWRARHSQKT
jgi:uncharacterized membrane protein